MTVLIYATLVYVAILVLALAVGLILIVYYLNSARASLAKIAAGLKQVNTNVEPLEKAVTTANAGLVAVRDNLRIVEGTLNPATPTPAGRG